MFSCQKTVWELSWIFQKEMGNNNKNVIYNERVLIAHMLTASRLEKEKHIWK
jgi:hypothetical protein